MAIYVSQRFASDYLFSFHRHFPLLSLWSITESALRYPRLSVIASLRKQISCFEIIQ